MKSADDLLYLPVAGGDEAQVLRGALERFLRFAGRCATPESVAALALLRKLDLLERAPVATHAAGQAPLTLA